MKPWIPPRSWRPVPVRNSRNSSAAGREQRPGPSCTLAAPSVRHLPPVVPTSTAGSAGPALPHSCYGLSTYARDCRRSLVVYADIARRNKFTACAVWNGDDLIQGGRDGTGAEDRRFGNDAARSE